MMQNPVAHILVIDDDIDMGELISAAAEAMGCTCIVTTNVTDLIAALNPNIALILVDLLIPDVDGIELLRILGKQQYKGSIVLMSGVDRRILETAENLTQSLGLSVIGILQKPFNLDELEKILRVNAGQQTLKDMPKHASSGESQISKTITKMELQLAIEREEFVPYYQPQIEIATGRMIGMEALVRWQHPERGLIMPDLFINLLEKFELIDQVGWMVLKNALKEFQSIANLNKTAITLSVNISPYSLHDLQFPDALIELVTRNHIEPQYLTLEITESGLFKELVPALDILTRLRMKQFNLAIDDFGTGYAMMQQLQNVPATELKIDKSLMHNIHKQESACTIVKKIIETGHELGMKIVAEGVDNAQQLEILRSNSCDIVQGYIFSRPLPISGLQNWIKLNQR